MKPSLARTKTESDQWTDLGGRSAFETFRRGSNLERRDQEIGGGPRGDGWAERGPQGAMVVRLTTRPWSGRWVTASDRPVPPRPSTERRDTGRPRPPGHRGDSTSGPPARREPAIFTVRPESAATAASAAAPSAQQQPADSCFRPQTQACSSPVAEPGAGTKPATSTSISAAASKRRSNIIHNPNKVALRRDDSVLYSLRLSLRLSLTSEKQNSGCNSACGLTKDRRTAQNVHLTARETSRPGSGASSLSSEV